MKEWTDYKQRASVPVRSFLDTASKSMDLELLAGRSGLNRAITEAAINRTGLALTGFFTHFAPRRIQLIGLAESAYLRSLPADEREARLDALFSKKIPCVVVARNLRLQKDICELADKRNVPVLRTKMITKHFINAATIIMENLMAPHLKVQGTMVEIMGVGVLITGKSGLGKSDAALGLIRQGHALVSDDITALRLDSAGNVLGAPVNVTRYHMEVRGVGIIHVPSLFGVASVRGEKTLNLVATLCTPEDPLAKRSTLMKRRTREIFGVEVPEVVIVVRPGRDLANVIETAALNQKLRRLGHDAEKELDQKLLEALNQGRNASE